MSPKQTHKPRILLTNDDGIDAPGMTAMRAAFANDDRYEVLVVAPFRERSASGCGLSLTAELLVEPRVDGGRTWGYAVDGLPADCVKFATSTLNGFKPDLVLSGINPGCNVGNSVFYSGTVGCAIEAAFLGVRAMAVSIWRQKEPALCFDATARLVREMVPWLLAQTWMPRTFWNLNTPNVTLDRLRGVRLTRQGTSFFTDEFSLQRTEGNTSFYRNVGKTLVQTPEAEDSDDRVMERGFASLTLLSTDLSVDVASAARDALHNEWDRMLRDALKGTRRVVSKRARLPIRRKRGEK